MSTLNCEEKVKALRPTSSEVVSKKIVNLINKYVRLRALHTKELAKNYGLSLIQLLCIQCLHENGRMSMSDIAENIMVSLSTMTVIIDSLEKKGFLQRRRISTDRRIITIDLREKGRSLAENSPPAVHHKIVHALEMLSEPKRKEILQALDSLSRLIDIGDGDQDPSLPSAAQQANNTAVHLRNYL